MTKCHAVSCALKYFTLLRRTASEAAGSGRDTRVLGRETKSRYSLTSIEFTFISNSPRTGGTALFRLAGA